MTKAQLRALQHVIAYAKSAHSESVIVAPFTADAIKLAEETFPLLRNEQRKGYQRARKEISKIWNEHHSKDMSLAIMRWLTPDVKC